MARIGGRPFFFEAQDCKGIEEELTKTFNASEHLAKESFNDLFENLTKDDQECQDFVGGRIIDVVGGISRKSVLRSIRGILAKQGILAQNEFQGVVTTVNYRNPNAKFEFTMKFMSDQAGSDFRKAVMNILNVVNFNNDGIRGIINGILGNIVADVVELGKEIDG